MKLLLYLLCVALLALRGPDDFGCQVVLRSTDGLRLAQISCTRESKISQLHAELDLIIKIKKLLEKMPFLCKEHGCS